MKPVLILFLIFISGLSIGQIRTVEYFNSKWEKTKEKKAKIRRVIIMENDTTFTLTDYTKRGKLLMKGQYRSVDPLIEHGFFEFYDRKTQLRYASGYYTNGQMTGVWKYYRNNYYVIQEIDYDIIEKRYRECDSTEVLSITPQIIGLIEKPTFKGDKSHAKFKEFLFQHLIYPPMAKYYLKEGRVIAQFTISNSGQICNGEIIESPSKDLSRELLRIISISAGWEPAKFKGVPIQMGITMPIGFTLK